MFRVHIETDNAAFEGDASHALSTMLRDLADRLDMSPLRDPVSVRFPLRDANGNGVGFAIFTPEEEA